MGKERGRGKNRFHAKAPLESTFQDRVLRDLRSIPFSYWEKISDRTTIGIPDIFGMINGYAVVIELKTRTRLEPLQFVKLEKAHKARAQSFCVTPENWAEVFAFLRSLIDIPVPPIGCLRKPARIPLWTIPPSLRERFADKPE